VLAVRTAVFATFAAVVSCALFLSMSRLIAPGDEPRGGLRPIAGIHFGPVELPEEIKARSRSRPEKPPLPGNPPATPRLQVAKPELEPGEMPAADLPDLDLPLVGGEGAFPGSYRQADLWAEGDIIPIVVIRPLYPREAAMAGTEGWVKVEFTITAVGTVENPRVIDAWPPRIFNREAIRAILKWKFKPRVVDGVAVERQATQVIDFTLDDS